MAYKVLNNILVKDAASSSLASLKTDLLVLVINKNTKNDSSFKELNKISKNYFSKTISSHQKMWVAMFFYQKLMVLQQQTYCLLMDWIHQLQLTNG